MAQKALKFTFARGDLASGMPQWVIDEIRQAIIDAGFEVLPQDDVPVSIEFMQRGADLDNFSDDTPHWYLMLTSSTLVASGVWGGRFGDPESLDCGYRILDWGSAVSYWDPVLNEQMPAAAELYFVADGQAGWWWCAIMGEASNEDEEVLPSLHGMMGGFRSRRYPADLSQGLACRYCLVYDAGAEIRLPYMMKADGSEKDNGAGYKLWSPLGSPFVSSTFYRYPGHPLPPLYAPTFPMIAMGRAPAYLGELEGLYFATHGFEHLSNPAPGLVAISWPHMEWESWPWRLVLPQPVAWEEPEEPAE